ncbi:hypothetical protein [Pseudonocardia thermophila]|jgi:hypothetical protein|uniref:hypothetical protein n=1 Tax=Pseudonocardia thermophila TaxID=1848 RepID=UPI00248F3DBC|nr:hypothetical protein [Pseudonocardia thermophila]
MTTSTPLPAATAPLDAVRLSTRFGVAFGICQFATMIGMTLFVLPNGGAPGFDVARGQGVHDAADLYRIGNYVCMVSGVLLGFLGAVGTRLRRIEVTGTLGRRGRGRGRGRRRRRAAVRRGAARRRDDTADAGADLRILAAWDSVAPYSLAFSALPFVGAIVLALRQARTTPWLVRTGGVVLVLSAAGAATSLSGLLFPLLALSTLGLELWVIALSVTWRT